MRQIAIVLSRVAAVLVLVLMLVIVIESVIRGRKRYSATIDGIVYRLAVEYKADSSALVKTLPSRCRGSKRIDAMLTWMATNFAGVTESDVM